MKREKKVTTLITAYLSHLRRCRIRSQHFFPHFYLFFFVALSASCYSFSFLPLNYARVVFFLFIPKSFLLNIFASVFFFFNIINVWNLHMQHLIWYSAHNLMKMCRKSEKILLQAKFSCCEQIMEKKNKERKEKKNFDRKHFT